MLLGGVLAMLLIGTPNTGRADDKPETRPDPLQEANRRLEMMRKMMEEHGIHFGARPGFRANASHPRLGAEVSAPGGALADQLDLPKDQGLVVDKVAPNMPAAKAGLKPHDILLELNGKKVPSKVADFLPMLAKVEANKPVDAVVLRKGKRETIKGLKLPEAKASATPHDDSPALPNFPRLEGFDFDNLIPRAAPDADLTTITRNDDQFTVTRKEGKRSVSVKGMVEKGKAKVQSVTIDDGSARKTYESLDKVPADYKKRVENLLEMVAEKPKVDDF